MNPPVSVVMACFNEENNIRRSVESIIRQSFTDFEFIIVDDGSTDATKSILEQLQSSDKRIRLLENSNNKGLAASLNRGIRNARGVYIARMDADDLSHEDRLSCQFNFMTQNDHIDILGTAIRMVDKATGRIKGAKSLPETHDQILKNLFFKPLVYHPTIMLKKSVYETHGYYNEMIQWGEDADLWFRIYDKVTFHNLNEVLVDYSVKQQLTKKILLSNLKNKFYHMRKRHLLYKYGYVLVRDFFGFSVRLIYNY